MKNTEYKIELLIEGLSKILPIAGAAGLGYLGVHAGEDFTGGVIDQMNSETGAGAVLGGEPLDPGAKMVNNLFNPDYKSIYELGRHAGSASLDTDPEDGILNRLSKHVDPSRANALKLSGGISGGLTGAYLGHSIGKSIKGTKKYNY